MPDDGARPHAATPTSTVAPLWRINRIRRLAARLLYPLFWAVNRPGAAWFGQAVYDFALRCNGIAINFEGRHGLNLAEEKFLRRLAPSLHGALVLDVGANTGTYAQYIAKLAPTATIYAFEPHPRTFRTLAACASDRLHAVNMAIGDEAGTMQLHDAAEHDGSTLASLSRDAVRLYAASTVVHDVPCTTIDDFLRERGIEVVDYLKIDTEGFDLNVLRGASKSIAAGRIKLIQFEFISANIMTRVRLCDFFEQLAGFDIYRLCVNGDLLPLKPYRVKYHEIYVNQNLIACRIEPSSGRAARPTATTG